MKKIRIKNTQKVAESVIDTLAGHIKAEKTILLPAKTIYGISCSFQSKKALEQVYAIKKRDTDLPFIILLADISQLSQFARTISAQAKILIEQYWNRPDMSPLTLIFKKIRNKENDILTQRDTIAVRVAEFSFVREAIKRSLPIISTSATISLVKQMPVKVEQVPKDIVNACDLVIDVEEDLLGIESTIIDVSGKDLQILREGAVESDQIRSLF